MSLRTAVKYDTAQSFHSPIGGNFDVDWQHGKDQKDSTAFLPPKSAKQLSNIIRSHIDEIGAAKTKKIPHALPLEATPANRQEYVEEASSEKQRKWACAQSGSARKNYKGKPSLTKKQAKEFCADTKLSGKKKKK